MGLGKPGKEWLGFTFWIIKHAVVSIVANNGEFVPDAAASVRASTWPLPQLWRGDIRLDYWEIQNDDAAFTLTPRQSIAESIDVECGQGLIEKRGKCSALRRAARPK